MQANSSQNNLPLWRRLWIYQGERFPVLGHGVMISAFTFSAVAYSRIVRGVGGFIGWTYFVIGVFITVSMFLLVRIFDEFKDQEEDRLYRPYLPVPRGLVTLDELKWVGRIATALQVIVLLIWQREMLPLYLGVMTYLLLMRVEFFIPEWLKARPLTYVLSHMVIIPLIDIYASGLDWHLSDAGPHLGLLWFFAVSFFNGLTLEFGRKIKSPEQEEEGVLSYTRHYGTQRGVLYWILTVLTTYSVALGAGNYAGYSVTFTVAITILLIVTIMPGILFCRSPSAKLGKAIAMLSILWTIVMYFLLGAIPMLNHLIF